MQRFFRERLLRRCVARLLHRGRRSVSGPTWTALRVNFDQHFAHSEVPAPSGTGRLDTRRHADRSGGLLLWLGTGSKYNETRLGDHRSDFNIGRSDRVGITGLSTEGHAASLDDRCLANAPLADLVAHGWRDKSPRWQRWWPLLGPHRHGVGFHHCLRERMGADGRDTPMNGHPDLALIDAALENDGPCDEGDSN
jgi:hypothetical protein